MSATSSIAPAHNMFLARLHKILGSALTRGYRDQKLRIRRPRRYRAGDGLTHRNRRAAARPDGPFFARKVRREPIEEEKTIAEDLQEIVQIDGEQGGIVPGGGTDLGKVHHGRTAAPTAERTG